MCGLILSKEPFGLLWVPQIRVLTRDEHPGLILTPSESRTYRFGLDDMSYCRPDEASATSDEDDGLGVLDRHDGQKL